MRLPFLNFPPATTRLLVVVALLAWSVSLVLFRIYLGHDLPDHGQSGYSLLWNLFLAALPLLWSSIFQRASARKRWIWALLSFVLWILFLPNAPYLLTDLVHLAPKPNVPLWYILAMLLSCAATGTLIGYVSLMDVHAAIERRFGFTAGWLLALISLMLCGFGIYLGRFLRWNSWDALTHPLSFVRTIIGQFADAGPHPHPLPVTLVFGGGLVIGYVVLRVLTTPVRAQNQTSL